MTDGTLPTRVEPVTPTPTPAPQTTQTTDDQTDRQTLVVLTARD